MNTLHGLITWFVHIFLFLEIMIKLSKTRRLQRFWASLYGLSGRFTPKFRSVPRDELAKSLEFLLNHERLPIVASALALNAMGMAIAVAFPSLVYLDMVGTAMAAFLLGPWYGAIVACLSSVYVNSAFFPDKNVADWVVVNVCGGLFWGTVASLPHFRRSGDAWGPKLSLGLLMITGVGAALFMAIPGALIQASLGPSYTNGFSYNGDVASVIQELAGQFYVWLDAHVRVLRTGELGFNAYHVATYAANAFRYVPDKVLTALVALLFIRYVYPMYWRLLVSYHPDEARVLVQPRQPLLFLVVFAVSIVAVHLMPEPKAAGASLVPTPAASPLGPPVSGGVASIAVHTPNVSGMYLLICLGSLVCYLVGSAVGGGSQTEAQKTCQRARAYQLIQKEGKTHEARFDARGPLWVLAVVLGFSIGFFFILVVFSSRDDAASAALNGTRGIAAIAVFAVFLLKFIQAGFQQQVLLDLVESLWQRAGAEMHLDAAQLEPERLADTAEASKPFVSEQPPEPPAPDASSARDELQEPPTKETPPQ